MEVICSIHKRDDKAEVKNYRRVTLLNTAYKIYASILNDKVIAILEEKLNEE